jgi:triosephosphate isomerase
MAANSKRTPIVGGNWKMNTDRASASDLARSIAAGLVPGVEVMVFPPFPYLLTVRKVLDDAGGMVALGAQDLWPDPNGAYTGEISTDMLLDCGVQGVLVGHSERRHVVGEPDALLNRKLNAALGAGLTAVLCVGETLEQREAGQTDEVNERQIRAGLAGVEASQMDAVVIAYEPVWAIGTGRTATPRDAQDAHARIRALLAGMYSDEIAQRTRIQYGGSVKPDNAAELFAQPDIDGGLIGGASLKNADFLAIVGAAAG